MLLVTLSTPEIVKGLQKALPPPPASPRRGGMKEGAQIDRLNLLTMVVLINEPEARNLETKLLELTLCAFF